MIFVTFVTLFFRRMKMYHTVLKPSLNKCVTNVTKITKVTKVTHFLKDKKREVAYLQIRCILLILGSYKTFIEKKRPFLNKNTGICYDYQELIHVRQDLGSFRRRARTTHSVQRSPGRRFHGLEA